MSSSEPLPALDATPEGGSIPGGEDAIDLRIEICGGVGSGREKWAADVRLRSEGKAKALKVNLTIQPSEIPASAEGTRADAVPVSNPAPQEEVFLARPSFGEVAIELLGQIGDEFRSAKHREQWRTSLEHHASEIWAMPVSDVDTEAVLRALNPIWKTKAETASRVRGRIERVLDAAVVRKLRPKGDNPARWKGNLQIVLQRQKRSTQHHAAMPYNEVPSFMARLQRARGVSPAILEFTILTAARSGESLGACWSELEDDVWVIPAERMKGGTQHRVPLTGRALEILQAQRERSGADTSELIFAHPQTGRRLSAMAMEATLRRLQVDITVHGFRSSFRDWAADRTAYPEEVIEEALAHNVGSAVRRAYRRGDALDKRRKLMKAWAEYCSP